MVNFENISEIRIGPIIAELLNRIHLFRLKPYDEKNSSAPDLWQKEGRKIICEIKRSLPTNILDSKEFDPMLRQIDSQINIHGADIFVLVVLSNVPDLLKHQLEEYFRKYIPMQFILHDFRFINMKLEQYPDLLNMISEESGTVNKITIEGVFENYREHILVGLKRNLVSEIDLNTFLDNPFKFEATTFERAGFKERLSEIEGQYLMLRKVNQEKAFFFINQFVTELLKSNSETPKQTNILSERKNNSSLVSYWLLKLSYRYWGKDAFKIGTEAFFNSYTFEKQKRMEYDSFLKIKINDLVIGYDFSSYNAVVCVFRVTKEVHQDSSYGEVINLVIENVSSPPILLNSFKESISFASELNEDNPIRLISITKEIFEKILNTITEEKLERSNSKYIATSRFAISDGVDPVLGVKSIAQEIAEMIRNLKTSDVGKMIGIFGNWGRGKTFMIEQIWKDLNGVEEKSKLFIRVNFHAWKYQDTNASWAYLYEAFAHEYFKKEKSGHSSWLSRKKHDLQKRFHLNKSRLGYSPLIRFALTLVLIVVTGCIAAKVAIDPAFKAFWLVLTTAGVADATRLIVKYFNEYKLKEKASEVFSKYFNKPSFKDLLGIQSEIQNELRHLIECWLPLQADGSSIKRIVLFVDDIDRCSEERIVQLIDALRVMLEDEEISKRVIVVAAIDGRILNRAIKWKYQPLLDADRKLENIADWDSATKQITSEYLDKLFLSGIKLGTLTPNERVDIYKEFSKGKVGVDEKQLGKINSSVIDITQVTSTNKAIDVEDRTISKSEKTVKIEEEIPVRSNSILDTIFGVSRQKNQVAEQKKTETSFELSYDENEFLVNLIANLPEATPRQIRIFYYRYMLARNLLTVALSDGAHETLYSTVARNQLLGDLLFHYTSLHSNLELIADRKSLLRKGSFEKTTVGKLIEDKDPILIGEVMDVLEMVIAY
jgi:mRNA-degrading endonuclease RelE of RelBE toxin-antitoxin system